MSEEATKAALQAVQETPKQVAPELYELEDLIVGRDTEVRVLIFPRAGRERAVDAVAVFSGAGDETKAVYNEYLYGMKGRKGKINPGKAQAYIITKKFLRFEGINLERHLAPYGGDPKRWLNENVEGKKIRADIVSDYIGQVSLSTDADDEGDE